MSQLPKQWRTTWITFTKWAITLMYLTLPSCHHSVSLYMKKERILFYLLDTLKCAQLIMMGTVLLRCTSGDAGLCCIIYYIPILFLVVLNECYKKVLCPFLKIQIEWNHEFCIDVLFEIFNNNLKYLFNFSFKDGAWKTGRWVWKL